jgi:hypothetical protein
LRIGLGEKNPFDEVEAQAFKGGEEEVVKDLNILMMTVIVSIIGFCVLFSIIYYCKTKKRRSISYSQSHYNYQVDAQSLASSKFSNY